MARRAVHLMRGSGLLLHVTSIPTPYGIGDLGPEAYRFVDFLAAAGQKYWQILPLNPTSAASGNSPYLSSSAFAGNTVLISPDLLVRDGLLDATGPGTIPGFPEGRVDYQKVRAWKEEIFDRVFGRAGTLLQEDPAYRGFCDANSPWLDDYALFCALETKYNGTEWNTWPEPVRTRDPSTLAACRDRYHTEIAREKVLQFLFFRQWEALHAYSRAKGIRIIGDLPLYLHFNSADLWARPDLFLLDRSGNPEAVAGVPPDYFSKTGQLWGNPLFRWEEHERTGFAWWAGRFRHNLSLFDRVRIDHFRGLVAYYAIPAGASDATGGRWIPAPARAFLAAMKDASPAFPVIAEDLGIITEDVREILVESGLPGMRVLQFAFTDETAKNPHAPHNHLRNQVVYTGTHDNAPVRGWYEVHATDQDRRRVRKYLGREYPPGEIPEIFIRLAMMSVAATAIVPVQDLLGLGDEARMNTPGRGEGNWEWRLVPGLLTDELALRLRTLTRVYGRL